MNTKIDPNKIDRSQVDCIIIDHYCIFFDREDSGYVHGFTWKLKRGLHYYYAYREYVLNGKIKRVYMHREICGCPKNRVPHHLNYYGLDNRKSNLEIMTVEQHKLLHNRTTRPKKFPKGS